MRESYFKINDITLSFYLYNFKKNVNEKKLKMVYNIIKVFL